MPPRIPLMPAIFPSHNKRNEALSPISIPPISEATGVKCSIALLPIIEKDDVQLP
jgi:hypothetical protein